MKLNFKTIKNLEWEIDILESCIRDCRKEMKNAKNDNEYKNELVNSIIYYNKEIREIENVINNH